MLETAIPTGRSLELIVASDAFARAEPEVRRALGPAVERISAAFAKRTDQPLTKGDLAIWQESHSKLQMSEFIRTFRPWIDIHMPLFSIEVGLYLVLADQSKDDDLAAPQTVREEARAELDALLGNNRVLCLPTSPILPPLRDATFSTVSADVDLIVELTCIAGLTGLPQINLPLGTHGGHSGRSLAHRLARLGRSPRRPRPRS